MIVAPWLPVVNGIPKSHWDCSFDNLTDVSPELEVVTLKFLEGKDLFWLYLYGPPGRGKTHFAVALHRALVAAIGWEGADSSIFVQWGSFMQELREGVATFEVDDILNTHLLSSVLILDDVTGRLTDFEVKALETIVKQRHASNSRLVITSNEKYETFLGLFGAHEVSRIKSICVAVPFSGVDRR